MSSVLRRIIYVLSYELFAIVLTSVALILLGFGGGHSGIVAVTSSAVALIWNYIWTSLFDAWEKRQESQVRTVGRRVVHALGFEGGLVLILVPILAWILSVTLLEALILEAGLLVFFLIYTFVFAWLFDRVLPAKKSTPAEVEESAK
ncbi:PACE efflux transporter [Glutamicibacter arilaitensis]|uniref:PACE efflux transporter n=1 Tax=Glutamicibacter arilaitensis TaxID=256701 RepID=UPI00384D4831